MRTKCNFVALVFLAVLYGIGVAQTVDQDLQGTVQGRVLTPGGTSVFGTKVYSVWNGPNGVLPESITNKNGRFSFRLRPGVYTLYATRDEGGFRDIAYEFLTAEPWSVKVTVYEGQVTRGVIIRVDTKKPKLIVETIDSKTGKPVNNPRMTLCLDENSNQCMSTNPWRSSHRFRLLLPSIPLGIKVSARGYDDWYYGGDGSQAQAKPLQLTPRRLKQLTVRLQPKTK